MDGACQNALAAVGYGVVDQHFDFGRSFAVRLRCRRFGRRDLALVPFPQINIATENAARENQRAKNSEE